MLPVTPIARPGLMRRSLALLLLLAGLGVCAAPAPAAAGPRLIPLAGTLDMAAEPGLLQQAQYYRRPYRRYYHRRYYRRHYRPYYRRHYHGPRRYYRRY